jgi:hypothetical protein
MMTQSKIRIEGGHVTLVVDFQVKPAALQLVCKVEGVEHPRVSKQQLDT